MRDKHKLTLWRLLPVVLVTAAASFWIADVQPDGAYVFRNLVPFAVLILLCGTTLYRGNGRWAGTGMRLPLGVIGYAIPALGLSLYLHYAYWVNLDDMFTGAEYPDQVFRYLPIYIMLAGGIGFAIGWIVGRNV